MFIFTVPARISSFGGLLVRPWRTTVALPCLTVGQPQPQRRWYCGGHPVNSMPGVSLADSGELVLSGLAPNHSGNYSCHVENSQGSDRIHYKLVVQGLVLKLFSNAYLY